MHSVKIILEAMGKKGVGDMLLVDVRIMLLSSLIHRPKLFASCVKVLQ